MDSCERTYSWKNFPKDIILLILQYLPVYFRSDLKLINKHWNRAVTSHIFYSLGHLDKRRIDYLLDKHPHSIRSLEIDQVNFAHVIREKCTRFTKLEELVWKINQRNLLDELVIMLKSCNNISSITLTDSHGLIMPLNYDLILQDLIDYLIAHSTLKTLCFNLKATYLMPLFQSLPLVHSLQSFSLELHSSQVKASLKVIKSINQLKQLNLKIIHQGSTVDCLELSTLIYSDNPHSQSLQHLSICILNYTNFEPDQIKAHIVNELSVFLTNPSAKKLKCFHYSCTGNGLDFTSCMFEGPVALHSPGLIKLTKLTLFTIDKYLMSHIINHCPNLQELTFNSPLILPHNLDSSVIKPFKYLTKLLFGGFQLGLIDNCEIIRKIFPNVVTLSPYSSISLSDNPYLDAYYIPNLFPNLKFVRFESNLFKLDKLVNDFADDLSWEELYITPNRLNKALLKALLEKLVKLRFLHINTRYFNSSLDSLGLGLKSFRTFSADPTSLLNFNYIITYENNL